MFGFSLIKLIFTIIAIIAAWRYFQWIAQGAAGKEKRSVSRACGGQAKPAPGGAGGGIEEMIKCRVCGVFVAVSNPASCGGNDCPYR